MVIITPLQKVDAKIKPDHACLASHIEDSTCSPISSFHLYIELTLCLKVIADPGKYEELCPLLPIFPTFSQVVRPTLTFFFLHSPLRSSEIYDLS